VALVAAGGMVGTGLRYALVLAIPSVGGIPVSIFGINVVGAFILGLLLDWLAHRGPDVGWSRRLRLGVGTGVFGGFTTYSTLAADNVTLALGRPALAAAYGLGTVVVGGVAALAGIAISRNVLAPAMPRTRRP
jgi:CrcB protein